VLEKADRHQDPMDIGERGLKIRSMFRNRPGRPRSAMSSGAPGRTAASVTRRATMAESRSPATSQATATNDDPAAMPPNQK